MTAKDPSRRRFISMALVAAATPVAISLMPSQAKAAPAAALPKLPLTNPQAKALSYTEDAKTAKSPAYKAGTSCADCIQYKGAAGQAYGPCTLFPSNTVAAKGWCAGWGKKP